MLLTEQDLYTHLYQEVIDEIKRDDDALPATCIAEAEEEAKAYLSRYDLDKLFGVANAAPIVPSQLLKNKVKDIACWFIIRKANPNVNYESFRLAYEDVTAFFKNIMTGKMSPDGWPLKAATDTHTPGASVLYTSNPQRRNHF